jgi:hypothetical protein
MPIHPLATYLSACRDRRSTGATTPETSLYSPLETLLNAATDSAKLKPRVVCFMNLKNQGAGMPDGGLFSKDQIARGSAAPPPGQAPARGVIECKPPKEDVVAIADTRQVSDYWERYNQVLVTNYREFVLIGRDDRGNPATNTIASRPASASFGSLPSSRTRRPTFTANGCSTSASAACGAPLRSPTPRTSPGSWPATRRASVCRTDAHTCGETICDFVESNDRLPIRSNIQRWGESLAKLDALRYCLTALIAAFRAASNSSPAFHCGKVGCPAACRPT